MKRTYKIALSLVMTLGLVAPTFAQDSFPDVSDTHWASDAIKRLKLEKFIQGMPNGNFEGRRNITRYEMASLVYAVYAKLVCFDEEVAKKIKDLEIKINNKSTTPAQPGPDYSDIKAALSALRTDVGTIKSWGSDISQLKKMAGVYSKELTSLGVDVSDMKRQLNDLSSRVGALEKRTDSVVMSGDVNLWAFAGVKESGFGTGVNQDGRYALGFGTQAAGTDTLGVLHELGLKLGNGATADRAWGAELVFGNMLQGIGDQSSFAAQLGTPYANGGPGNMYINSAWIAAPELLNSTIGRQGMNLGNFILARPDITSFYSNSRWDNGSYLVDGIKTGQYSIGGIKASAFAGTIAAQGNAGGLVQPINLNGLQVNRVHGGQLGFGLGQYADLTASYVNYDGDTGAPNRVEVYGVDGDIHFMNFNIKAGAGKSSGKLNQTTVLDTDNTRWNVSTKLFNQLEVGYANIERNYVAPGDWGRTGIFRNLNNVKKFTVGAGFDVNSNLSVNGGYETNKEIVGVGETTGWNVGIATQLTPKWNLNLGYESTMFDTGFGGLANGSFAKFTTVGLKYAAGGNSMLNLFYQYGDTNGVVSLTGGVPDAQKGGFAGMQYSIRF